MKIFSNKCIVCNKLFETTDKNKNKCSKECLSIYLSQKKKENWKNPEYRKNQSQKIKKGQNNSVSKEKMAQKKRGKSPWNKGISCSGEVKEKISKANKGRIAWNKGKSDIYSKETKEKIALNTKIQMIKDEMKEKIFNIKKQNNSFKLYKSEKFIYDLLIDKYGKEDVEWQYRSKEYPFTCNFYVKSLNLYIEFQGTWTHGQEPYDENNEEHEKLVKEWKSKNNDYYDCAVNVWTVSDPYKRQIAQENNLNWLEFFSINEFLEWYNNVI